MIKTVKEIKELLKVYILPGYSFKTNFSSKEFLVEIDNGLIIKTEPIIEDKKVIYKFMLDTQFLSNSEVTYDEIVMIKNIIQVLESNRKFVLSKFKNYTVDELLEEERIRKEKSEKMLESLKQTMLMMRERNGGNCQ